MLFETLEGRRLLSAGGSAFMSGGNLVVRGTAGDDAISVTPVVVLDRPAVPGTFTLSVRFNDGPSQLFTVRAGARVVVKAGAGNDTVNLGGHTPAGSGPGGLMFTSGLPLPVRARVDGGRGDDTIYGGDGDDVLRGGAGNDRITGGAGNDRLEGGAGNDELGHLDPTHAEPGDDLLLGGRGDDHLAGGAGDDFISGGAGDDTLWGEAGDDRLLGGAGDDGLYGGLGNDRLLGGRGADRLSGGSGTTLPPDPDTGDDLRGGPGRDTFYTADGPGELADRRPDEPAEELLEPLPGRRVIYF